MNYPLRLLMAIQRARASGFHQWAAALEAELKRTIKNNP